MNILLGIIYVGLIILLFSLIGVAILQDILVFLKIIKMKL